jgi:AcrR family transcriptional regulator
MDDELVPSSESEPRSVAEREEAKRRRAVLAMAGAVDSLGYANTTVHDVLCRAGMSRRTFYELFENREDCFLATYDEARAEALERIRSDCNPQETWIEFVRATLAAILEYLASQPELARVLLVEPVAVGPPGLERHEHTMAALADRLARSRTGSRRKPSASLRLRCEATVGGVHRVLHARIAGGRARELPQLLPALTSLVAQLDSAD